MNKDIGVLFSKFQSSISMNSEFSNYHNEVVCYEFHFLFKVLTSRLEAIIIGAKGAHLRNW